SAPAGWADDPSFELAFHVRHMAVAPPGTHRQLLDLAAVLYEDPFDRARPLWNLTIVEGLEGGRAALLAKLHHTITDGVGGVRLSMQFLDLARDAADPDDIKSTAKGLGGTVNDAFVTAIAGGAAAYHRSQGADVDELRMTMPVNVRDDRSAGGNAFSPTRVLVPAGIVDPVERFAAVHERLAVTKGERAVRLWEGLAGIISTLPTSVLTT